MIAVELDLAAAVIGVQLDRAELAAMVGERPGMGSAPHWDERPTTDSVAQATARCRRPRAIRTRERCDDG